MVSVMNIFHIIFTTFFNYIFGVSFNYYFSNEMMWRGWFSDTKI
jgi:hypothetical protein